MPSEPPIQITGLGKMYKLYDSPVDRLLDAFGLAGLPLWREVRFRPFWALRGLDLTVQPGERVALIGRNGAGKSTLLKTICGKLFPTEGEAQVRGRVQALLEMGTGFHPELSGRENIRASLAYQDMEPEEIAAREAEIIEFTELEDFIDQPVKTYSAGMYARLAFTTATAIEPEILIVDEVLGAGDAYFATKCMGRMKQLTEDTGATVLFVSHDLSSVQRLCTRAIWIERGRVVQEGDCLRVVKAYERYVREIEDRKLRAKNLSRASGGQGLPDLELHLRLAGSGQAELRELALLHDTSVRQLVGIGDAQDSSPDHPLAVRLETGVWSEPLGGVDRPPYRAFPGGATDPARLRVDPACLVDGGSYALRLRGTLPVGQALDATFVLDGEPLGEPRALAPAEGGELDAELPLPPELAARFAGPEEGAEAPAEGSSRWPSRRNAELRVARVQLRDARGLERAAFEAGEPMTVELVLAAGADIEAELLPLVVVYRDDGLLVTRFQGDPMAFRARDGEERRVHLQVDDLLLGDGRFTVSVALYDGMLADECRFDLLDRSFEFAVRGNAPGDKAAVLRHPGSWVLPEASAPPSA